MSDGGKVHPFPDLHPLFERHYPKGGGGGGGGGGEPPADNKPDDGRELAEAITEVNQRFFVVQIGGMVATGTFERDATLGRDRLWFFRPQDFVLKYRNRRFPTGRQKANGEPIYKDLGNLWYEHPSRRQYERAEMVCSGKCPPDTLNLWRGWGCKPTPGPFPVIADHLLNVLCDGDEGNYTYLLNLLARWLQHPGKQGEVAIVLRGKKGIGKGQFAALLMRWFHHHAMAISQPSHLTGRFNSHLVDCLLLFADEVVWGGDKQSEGPLKALVTEKTVTIEPKGQNSFQAPNRVKLLIASNSDWAVPVTGDERRYFVLDVPPTRLGDALYFDNLAKAIEGDEGQALLGHLLSLNIDGFNHRAVPHTKGLNSQKIEGLDSLGKWWLDSLILGEFVGLEGGALPWSTKIEIRIAQNAYVKHAQSLGDRHPVAMNRFLPRTKDKYLSSLRVTRTNNDPRCYILPSLVMARQEFLSAMRIMDWCWEDGCE